MRNLSASKTEKPQRKANNKENNLYSRPSPSPGFAQSTSSRKNRNNKSSETNALPKLHNKILQKPNYHPEWKKIFFKKKLEKCNNKIPTKDLLQVSHVSKTHLISINYIDSSNRLLNVNVKRIKQLKFVSLNLRLPTLRLLLR